MLDDPQPKPSRRFFSASFFLVVLAMVGIAGSVQAQDIADKFPDPARVTADYPDPAERYAAFETLDTVLTSVAPKPVSQTAYKKLFAYEANYNNIESTHLQSGAQSPAYKEWVLKRDSAIGDFALAHAVLARYQLSGLRAAPHPVPTPQPTPQQMPEVKPPVSNPNPGLGYDPKLFTAPRRQFVSQHTAFFFLLPVALLSWA
jgi:hypothetical protein